MSREGDKWRVVPGPGGPDPLVPGAIVTRRGAARWRRGHPWIYRSDVATRPDAAAGGVAVADERGRALGMALWSPSSEISLRMLTREIVELDVEFWSSRIRAAVSRRAGLDWRTTAYRAIHAEADGLPSLVVDVLGSTVVVQLLSAGLEAYRGAIVDGLREALTPSGILARNDVSVRELESLPVETALLYGEVPERVEVEESGIRYQAAPWSGQKTGAFLDQRENRVLAGELSRGRTLDAFCYHGSFALHLARGADTVMAVDISADALARARDNAVLNGFGNIETVEANAFDRLRALESEGARFDVIVLDPPAFAKHRSTAAKALRGYKEINLRALRLLAPGGHLLTFSCSYHISPAAFREMLAGAASDAGRSVRWVRSLGQASDHPEILQIPETGYLKGAVLEAVAAPR